MKITTWNVNGIRAVLGKSGFDWVSQPQYSPDVLCMQEVKVKPEQVDPAQLTPFACCSHITWNCAQRPGYSGVATLSKQPPAEAVCGMGFPEFDVEGRLIRSRHDDFLLFNVYFPNGQRGQDRVGYKLDFYAKLLDQCDQLHAAGENIIITGDFNTAHKEIDLANPKSNQKTSGFLPEERVWIDYYLEHGFVDAFRVLYPDKVQYTWWTYITNARARNVGWRLDYFLVSAKLMPRVQDVVIHNEIMGSDHCPVTLTID
ncbi:MAG: exodeoxyribonuclease III [Chloroflexota bacterium]